MATISSPMLVVSLLALSTNALAGSKTIDTKPEAASAAREADARCYWTGAEMMKSLDPTSRNAGLVTTMYFWGRIEANVAKSSMETLLTQQYKALASSDAASEQQRCGLAIQESGKRMVQLGEAINKREDTPSK